MKSTWLLVANAAQAKIFACHSDKTLVPVTEIEPAVDFKFDQNIENLAAATTDRFAKSITTFLEDGRMKNSFQSIVLVGEPQFLNSLTLQFSKLLDHSIGQIIHKNSVHLSQSELEKIVYEDEPVY